MNLLRTLASLLSIALWSSLAAETTSGRWRLPDGTFSDPPETESVSSNRAVVRPGTEGAPALPLPFPVKAGEVVAIQLTLEARTTDDDQGAEGQAGIILTVLPRASATNYNPNAEHRQIAIIGTEPETMRFAFRAQADHEAGALVLVPTLSYFGRTLEISGLTFTHHGADADPAELTAAAISYPGQEPDAPWRTRADEMIDLFRKADLRVLVTDRLGTPLPGIPVSIEQQRHAYPFGTAIVSSRIVDAPRVFSPESGVIYEEWLADNARYREEILRNFNTVVTENDLKWPQWTYSETTLGIYHQDWTLDALDWFARHDVINKGHTLVWGSWRFTPTWLRDHEADPDALQQAVLAHIRDIGGATANRTQYWDVLNEPMSHRNLINILGMDSVSEWFKTAREVLPNTRLVMNDFDLVGNGGNPERRRQFLEFYQELHERNTPIDLIGFQGHFWSERFTPPEKIWEIIDEVHNATGLPLMISEFDSNLPNEQMQADYTRDFLTAWFAHPATEAFIMWGFWGGAHWMGDAGSMFRRDWSEKPNLHAYRQLVYDDWWTRETRETDEQGTIALRAFHGIHELSITHPDYETVSRTLSLKPDGQTLHIILHKRQARP